MMTQSFEELVATMAAKTPTPGGGAAAAMAGCMGASLFLMTVRFSQGKKANVDREDDLARAESALSAHLDRLMPMAERDCKAFDLVSAAFRMPKEADEQKAARSAAIQESMVGAMLVPEETQKMILDVFASMEAVSRQCPSRESATFVSGLLIVSLTSEPARRS